MKRPTLSNSGRSEQEADKRAKLARAGKASDILSVIDSIPAQDYIITIEDSMAISSVWFLLAGVAVVGSVLAFYSRQTY